MGGFPGMAVISIMMKADHPFVVMVGYGSMDNQDCGSKTQDQYSQPAVHGDKDKKNRELGNESQRIEEAGFANGRVNLMI